MGKLNILFFKTVIVIALVLTVWTVLISNPPVGAVLALVFLAWAVPRFRP